jgi:hypothetical protein
MECAQIKSSEITVELEGEFLATSANVQINCSVRNGHIELIERARIAQRCYKFGICGFTFR